MSTGVRDGTETRSVYDRDTDRPRGSDHVRQGWGDPLGTESSHVRDVEEERCLKIRDRDLTRVKKGLWIV